MGYDTFIYPLWGDMELRWESSITYMPEEFDAIGYEMVGEKFDPGG